MNALDPHALSAAYEAHKAHAADPGRKGSGIEKAISAYLAATTGRETRQASERIGAWLSAALDDPGVAQSMKDDINAWFAAGQPVATAEVLGWFHEPTGNVFTDKDHAEMVPKWQERFPDSDVAADFTPLARALASNGDGDE